MKTKLTWIIWLAIIGFVAWAYLHRYLKDEGDQATPEKSVTMGEIWGRRDANLARQYSCPLLSDRFSSSNNLFTIEIEHFFADNKRVALRGYLADVYESGNKFKAIFEFKFFDKAPEDTKLYAVLECPTNLVSKLTSMRRYCHNPWGLVVDVDDCRLRFSENSDEGIKSSEVGDLKHIEGRLIAIEPP